MHSISDLPGMERTGGPATPLNICFVTREYLGHHKCGGIGTAVTAWAEALAGDGHNVTVLLTQEGATAAEPAGGNAPLVRPLPPSERYNTGSPLVTTAHRVFTDLMAGDFDIIYFHDWLGQGMYTLLAKRQGLAFEKTLLCMIAHGSTPWANEANQRLPESVHDIEAEFMERQSVELADVLISPSRYMASWMTAYGWKLPPRTYLLPYTPPPSARQSESTLNTPRTPQEIVFFGRLEPRKGLALFCGAMDVLAKTGHASFNVTFLGRPTRIEGQEAEDYLRQRSREWPFPCSYLLDLDRQEALGHLGSGRCLAVIPSLSDNSPNTVYECASAAIPFIAADTGGISEIIAPMDRERVLFAPRADALAQKLREALFTGVRPAAAAMAPGKAREAWLNWHAHLEHSRFWQRPGPAAASLPPLPLVSVCLTHHDRPRCLVQALDSLKAQDYANFEVVLVDDGSALPESHLALDALEADFAARDWTLARQDNRYLGAARNACAALAKGEYLLFMDDDNLALPWEVSTLVRAALASGADILTCASAFYEMPGQQDDMPTQLLGYHIPLGGAPGPGFLYNGFGDANALVKTTVFHQLGGFTEETQIGFEDWEFLAKAVLAGFTLQAVPFVLYEYRSSAMGMLRTTNGFHNLRRAMRPFLAPVLREFGQALLLGRSASERLPAANDEIHALRHALEQSNARQESPLRWGETLRKGVFHTASTLPAAFCGALRAILNMSPPVKLIRRLRRERDARLLRESPCFDAAWYLAANPDVAAAAADPAIHYLAHGAAEGRNPGPGFDTRFYLAAHSDVAAAGVNPLTHYIRHGKTEKRQVKPAGVPGQAVLPGKRDARYLQPAKPAGGVMEAGRDANRPVVICPVIDWPVSGALNVTEHIGRGLRLLGWDFRILFTSEPAHVLESAGGHLPALPHDFLPIEHLGDAAFASSLARCLSEQRPGILFCGCNHRANAVAAQLPKDIGVVVYTHSDDQAYYNQSYFLRDACHANICVSRAIAEKVRRMPGMAAKAHHIPNGGVYRDEVRFRSGGGEPVLSCVYTGRLIQDPKRILDFIELARLLEETGRPYRVTLAGQSFSGAEDVLRRELASQIRNGSVCLPGRMGRDEVLRELDKHNFFVLLSEFEGFSLSLAEAMGRGCVPVVSATESGSNEAVSSGHNGMVMPHRDYKRWASWLCEASLDADAWLRMSHAASDTILSSFTIEHQVQRIDALLRSLWKLEIPR